MENNNLPGTAKCLVQFRNLVDRASCVRQSCSLRLWLDGKIPIQLEPCVLDLCPGQHPTQRRQISHAVHHQGTHLVDRLHSDLQTCTSVTQHLTEDKRDQLTSKNA